MNEDFTGTYYENEHLKFLDAVASFSGSRDDFEKIIDGMSHVSGRARREHVALIKQIFTQNTVLSNQKNSIIPEIDTEMALLLARKSCTRLDTTRSELFNMQHGIIRMFSYLITRSIGDKRERILQIPTTRREDVSTTIDRRPEEKKRGWIFR